MKQTIKSLIGIILAASAAGIALTTLGGCGVRRAVSAPPLDTPHHPHPAPSLAVVKADAGVQQIANADTDFGFRLLAQLTPEKPNGNVFFSPFSISQALDLTLNGAGGPTRQDIATTLGLGTLPNETVNAANGLLLPSLENPDPQVTLTVANALWIQQGLAFKPDFQTRCRQFYDADTTELDLRGPNGAATINDWVKGQTQGKIDSIVSPDDLASATTVLTNAVYFHGQWAKQFDKTSTRDAPFTRPDGSQKTVSLMSQESEYSYLETPDFQAVRLPYGMGRMAMYVFLPKSPSGLDGFLKTATAAQWDKWVTQMQPTQVQLFLPRFHIEDKRTLNNPLKQMGMMSAFGSGADFGPMGLPGSYISKVLHKATLDVDEEGTIATAATAVFMQQSRVVSMTMRVDHPFYCTIRDDATGTILFLGAIRDPQ